MDIFVKLDKQTTQTLNNVGGLFVVTILILISILGEFFLSGQIHNLQDTAIFLFALAFIIFNVVNTKRTRIEFTPEAFVIVGLIPLFKIKVKYADIEGVALYNPKLFSAKTIFSLLAKPGAALPGVAQEKWFAIKKKGKKKSLNFFPREASAVGMVVSQFQSHGISVVDSENEMKKAYEQHTSENYRNTQ